MKRALFLIMLFWSGFNALWSNSINLFNNTDTKLTAIIIGADGTVLDEVILNSRDASTWADDVYQFGSDPSTSRTPYTVNWYCMGGQPFGSCTDVAEGSIVLAQSCSGAQECPEE